MKLLDRHISQAVLLEMIVVLGVIVALDVIFSLVAELGEALPRLDRQSLHCSLSKRHPG